ncbi:MAG: hypothetical protein GY906_07415 [bacterium]|nr:hypothetical protein [bacterium]
MKPSFSTLRNTTLLFLTVTISTLVAGCRTAISDESSAQTSHHVPTAIESKEPIKNTVRWVTASEVENFGFDIYRGTSEDGPFDRITEDPLEGAGTTDEPQKYVYVDDTIEAGQSYYYYVESISMAGVREKFSPTFYVKPKWPTDSRNAPADNDKRGPTP